MTEVGLVTKVNNKRAVVKVDKKDECSKCGMCLFPNNASFIEFNADNQIGASVGDTVVIETAEKTKLLGILLVFLVPLLLIGLMAVINYTLIFSDIWFLIGSVILVILWYTILAVIDKKLIKNKSFATTIIEIYNKKEKENE